MHRASALLALLVLSALLAGCATRTPRDEAPWKGQGPVEVITAAPDAGGPLSFRNCPTLAEARAAVPAIVDGPDANGVPFKTMVLQCLYTVDGRDVQGRPAGIAILVFDAAAEGLSLWEAARTDPVRQDPTDVPGLADVAFVTGRPAFNDLWVVQGGYGFHMSHTRQVGIPGAQLVALGRAMLAGLERPPR